MTTHTHRWRGSAAALSLAIFLISPAPALPAGTIYSWTDSDGIRHFANKEPSGVDEDQLNRTGEMSFDPVADERRTAREEKWRTQQEALEVRERLAKTEKMAAAAHRQAAASARKAERLEQEVAQLRREKEDTVRQVVFSRFWWPGNTPVVFPPPPRPDPGSSVWRPYRPLKPHRTWPGYRHRGGHNLTLQMTF